MFGFAITVVIVTCSSFRVYVLSTSTFSVPHLQCLYLYFACLLNLHLLWLILSVFSVAYQLFLLVLSTPLASFVLCTLFTIYCLFASSTYLILCFVYVFYSLSYLLLHCKSNPKAFTSSIELINLICPFFLRLLSFVARPLYVFHPLRLYFL